MLFIRFLHGFGNKRIKMSLPEAEIEVITTELIKETEKKLRHSFNKELKHELRRLHIKKTWWRKAWDSLFRRNTFSDETNPINCIEKEFVDQVMQTMIKEAVAQRNLLVERIEKDVETGMLYSRYYGKIEEINALTSKAYIQMQNMDRAQKKYEEEKILLSKVSALSLAKDVKPTEGDENKKTKYRRGDMFSSMRQRARYIEKTDYDKK